MTCANFSTQRQEINHVCEKSIQSKLHAPDKNVTVAGIRKAGHLKLYQMIGQFQRSASNANQAGRYRTVLFFNN